MKSGAGDGSAPVSCRYCDDEVFRDDVCELHFLRRRELEKDWHMGVGH